MVRISSSFNLSLNGTIWKLSTHEAYQNARHWHQNICLDDTDGAARMASTISRLARLNPSRVTGY